jgi:hypothetical protein
MFTGRVFRFITRPGRLHLPSVSIRRSCSKHVLVAGRYRAKVLLVSRPYADPLLAE